MAEQQDRTAATAAGPPKIVIETATGSATGTSSQRGNFGRQGWASRGTKITAFGGAGIAESKVAPASPVPAIDAGAARA